MRTLKWLMILALYDQTVVRSLAAADSAHHHAQLGSRGCALRAREAPARPPGSTEHPRAYARHGCWGNHSADRLRMRPAGR